jgi:guanosine-3',5'-bis(diphosphate) 3'-pyrophosphohydrolase
MAYHWSMWSPELYQRAVRFAAERHAGQTVPGTNLPYLLHVTQVTAEVMRGIALEPLSMPDLAIACALLHDTVEDTQTTAEEIATTFGDEVARGVLALSKNAQLPKELQLDDSLCRIRECSHEVWAVKLADRITNLQAPPARWGADKRRIYREEARRIHTTLANAHGVLAARLAERIEAYAAYL